MFLHLSVSHSVRGGCPGAGPGVSRPRPRGSQARGRGQAPGGVSQHALRQTPPQQTATAADGMHPTGIHSSYKSDTKGLFTLSVNGNAAMLLAISL